MFRSATTKLTLYYLLIIAVISLAFSAVVYKIGTDDLAYGLHRQTQRISSDFPVFSHSPYLKADNELRAGSHRLIQRLIGFNALVLVAAGFASYALARRTLQPIEASHEQQKRFTADVSHELRTPLTALKMESEVTLLDPKASKEALRQTITSNIEEAEKLTNLVGNLLRLSQFDADGPLAGASQSTALAPALQAAVQQLQPLAHKQAITMNTDLAQQAVLVGGDQATLTQLFVILLDNAIKYSSSGSTVTMLVKQQPNTVQVSVQDQGRGIAKNDLNHIFERFYRADSARAGGVDGGYGLGLSIAKLITDSLQGSISITSRLGSGTTAMVYLPRADQTTQRDDQSTAPDSSPK